MKTDLRPYTDWEDWKNGMYRDASKSDRERLVLESALLLKTQNRLIAAMREVTIHWKYASEANLSEPPNNRAWLGQAACCYAAGSPEDATRQAWGTLTDAQRSDANRIADMVISEWKYRTLRNPQRMLFDA